MSKGYELSQAADQDVEDIYDYTALHFGEEQAIEYLLDLKKLFIALSDNPKLGRVRDEIKPGLRSFSKASHVIFYRILDSRLRIVRVLHASRDITRFNKD